MGESLLLKSSMDWGQVRSALSEVFASKTEYEHIVLAGDIEGLNSNLGSEFLSQFEFSAFPMDQAVAGLEDLLTASSPASIFVVFIEEFAQSILPVVDYCSRKDMKWLATGGYDVGGFLYDDPMVMHSLRESFHEQGQNGYLKVEDPGTIGDYANLCQALSTISHLDGDVVECGCFNGSSSGVMLDYYNFKDFPKRTFHFFDVFSGFDYEEAMTSTDTLWAGTHKSDGYEVVKARLEAKHGKNVVNVKVSNVITDDFLDGIDKIALANLDVDILEAVEVGLMKLAPKIVPGGILICEDAGHTPILIGARLALERFLKTDIAKGFVPIFMESGQVFLVKR